MKDRNKIINDIVLNVLEIIPRNKDTLNITIEDFDSMEILELEITLNIKELVK